MDMECRTRPEITEDRVKQIRNVIAENPYWNRTKISKHIRTANWVRVGLTTGRGRDGGHKNAILPIKDVYLYPLVTCFRQALSDMEGAVRSNELR